MVSTLGVGQRRYAGAAPRSDSLFVPSHVLATPPRNVRRPPYGHAAGTVVRATGQTDAGVAATAAASILVLPLRPEANSRCDALQRACADGLGGPPSRGYGLPREASWSVGCTMPHAVQASQPDPAFTTVLSWRHMPSFNPVRLVRVMFDSEASLMAPA